MHRQSGTLWGAAAAACATVWTGCASEFPISVGSDIRRVEKAAMELAQGRLPEKRAVAEDPSGEPRRRKDIADMPTFDPRPPISGHPIDPFEDGTAFEKLKDVPERLRDLHKKWMADIVVLESVDPMFPRMRSVRLDLRETIRRAVANSHAVKIAGFIPAIRATSIMEAEGAFDTTVFFKGDDTDPVSGFDGVLYKNLDQPLGASFPQKFQTLLPPGSFLAEDLESRRTAFRFGASRKLATGAQLQVSQRMTNEVSNGLVNVLNPQSTTTLDLSIMQPLLRGGGLNTNQAGIRIAVSGKQQGIEEFRRSVMDHVAEVERAYWDLAEARRLKTIRERRLRQQTETARWVAAREREIPLTLQERARASVADARADLIESANDIRIAQERLKNLLNDPGLPSKDEIEVIPVDTMPDFITPTDDDVRAASMRAALGNRPQIRLARLKIWDADIRLGVARNDALPVVNLFARTSPQGLDYRIGSAMGDELKWKYTDWTFGINVEIPIGNRVARARLKRSGLEREQSLEQLAQVVENACFEVAKSLISVDTAQTRIVARRRALEAAASELFAREIQLREGNLQEGVSNALEFLLTGQERLAAAHRDLVDAQADYRREIVSLEQSKGTLLHYNNINLLECPEDGKRYGAAVGSDAGKRN